VGKMTRGVEKIGFKDPLTEDYEEFFYRYNINDKMAEFSDK
jgi:hypothetical protein